MSESSPRLELNEDILLERDNSLPPPNIHKAADKSSDLGEGNRIQYTFNEELLDTVNKLSKFIPNSNTQAYRLVLDITDKIKSRNKKIRIADAFPAGLGTVREYEPNAMASDSEDERKIRQAETRAIRTSKEKSKSRQQPYTKNPPLQQPAESYGNPAYAQHYQRNQQQPFRGSFARREPCSIDTCHYCKQQGHWRKNCPLLASLRSSNSNSTTYQK
ncbi:Hypothetical predicted protein [Mytilus galloprovincialis]|uniref:CCHC-type domain-containing protein n=1 Tax=Mytilus galloprovincialis TaxID=29158 RepID=A0A8B6HBD6_MYTGA|nr:Hypothetical predicted protein [Mytilus galloprovincialis]